MGAHELTKRKNRLPLLVSFLGVVAFAVTGAAAQSGATVVESDAMIHCEFSTLGVFLNCDPERRGPELQFLDVGEQTRVTLTATWDPVYSSAEFLNLSIVGNYACRDAPGTDPRDYSCAIQTAQGRSPLSVTLTGVGASNGKLQGLAQAAKPCWGGDPCELPYMVLVKDQPVRYTWTLE